jgi:hypothetical protein
LGGGPVAVGRQLRKFRAKRGQRHNLRVTGRSEFIFEPGVIRDQLAHFDICGVALSGGAVDF